MEEDAIEYDNKIKGKKDVNHFFKKLLYKIEERMKHDEIIYGNSFIQLNINKNGLLDSITFEKENDMEEKE